MTRRRNAAFAVPLLLSALFIVPCAAPASERTQIVVVNDTGIMDTGAKGCSIDPP